MTLEELRTEAKRQGYNLVPIPKSKPKMLPCPVCGKSRRDYRNGLDICITQIKDPDHSWKRMHCYKYGFCHKCGFKGPVIERLVGDRESDVQAISAWNEYITKGETYWDEHPEQKPE